jgi:hypothetical protein
LSLTLVCSLILRAVPADAAPPVPAAEKGSTAVPEKAGDEGNAFVEQESPVFENEKPRRGAPLVVGAAVVLVVAAVYFLALKKPSTASTRIEVNSVPDGANITLDGRNSGKVTSYTFPNVTPGSHAVKLSKSGYEDFLTTVIVRKGQTAVVNAALIPVQ